MDDPVTRQPTKPEWHQPTLNHLGDAATLTAAQALATNDGAGGSS
jgi:hypothetical protein